MTEIWSITNIPDRKVIDNSFFYKEKNIDNNIKR